MDLPITITDVLKAKGIEFVRKPAKTQDFNIKLLFEDFSKICPDFCKPIQSDAKSLALNFCNIIVFEVGPESSKARKMSRDMSWTFKFPNAVNGKPDSIVIVSTACRGAGLEYNSSNKENTMSISVIEAGLIAVKTLCDLIEYGNETKPDTLILTPLAASIYSKSDVINIAKELNSSPKEVLIAINCSCQRGGHYLENSKMYIAAAAVLNSNRNTSNKENTNFVVNKILNDYLDEKKEWDQQKFNIYFSFSYITKIPPIAELIERFDRAQQERCLRDLKELTQVDAVKTIKEDESDS